MYQCSHGRKRPKLRPERHWLAAMPPRHAERGCTTFKGPHDETRSPTPFEQGPIRPPSRPAACCSGDRLPRRETRLRPGWGKRGDGTGVRYSQGLGPPPWEVRTGRPAALTMQPDSSSCAPCHSLPHPLSGIISQTPLREINRPGDGQGNQRYFWKTAAASPASSATRPHILNLFQEVEEICPKTRSGCLAAISYTFLKLDPRSTILFQVGRRTGGSGRPG